MSDVICEECSKFSGKTSKANDEKKQSVLKPPMKLRIFLQISEYNYETDELCKNKIKIYLPTQYSMSFPGIYAEELYILISFKLHIGNDMDKVYYVCEILEYNTGIWWNFYDGTITPYPGYPMNVYGDLSID